MRASILLLAVLAAVAVAVNADCTSPKEKGKSCAAHRYYYKKNKGKCVKFYYRGRGGNENNFKTKSDCEAECPENNSVCKKNKDSGNKCGGIRYYYDTEKGKCVRFNYKGRQGNENNYKTKEECVEACENAPAPVTAPPELTYDVSTACSTQCRGALSECADRSNCVVSCPDISATCLSSGGTIWGHDIYTDDSSLCRAAVNAGIIPATGGVIVVNDLPGQGSYAASDENGISTSSYGNWGASCSFNLISIHPTPEPVETQGIVYDATTACSTQCRGALNECADRSNCIVTCPDISATCLSSGGTIWGHDIYTDDSSMCRAAVNAGVIPATGGVIRVNDLPGQSSYASSTENGISTSSYGNWGASCSFDAL